jgi:hypothetical protein
MKAIKNNHSSIDDALARQMADAAFASGVGSVAKRGVLFNGAMVRDALGAEMLERTDGFDRRTLAIPAPRMRGVIRPGFAEAAPRRERRQYPDAGME